MSGQLGLTSWLLVWLAAALLGSVDGQNALYDGLDSCIELVPGELNMHYKVLENGTLDMALEGLVFEGNAYLSFGFAAPSARSSKMVGGTAVVAGTAGDACFAQDYYLGGEVECDFATGSGSCPSSVSSANGVKPYPVELVACERDGDALAVRFRRPLGQSGEQGYWPVDGSQYAMYAVGLVGDGSNTQEPEVLDHYLETKGALVIKLDAAENSCTTILASGNPLDTSSSGVASPTPGSNAEQATTTPSTPVNVGGSAQYGDDHDDDDDDDDHDGEGEAEGEAGRHDDDDHDDDEDDEGEGEAGSYSDNSMIGSDRTAGNPTGTALACQMEIEGEIYPFQICDLVGGIGSNFYLAWNISAAPDDPSSTILTMGMNSTMSQQYISVGFPSRPDSMVNAAAMILESSSTGGTTLKQYYMDGYDVSDVYVSTKGLDLLDAKASTTGDVAAGVFVAKLPYPFSSASKRRMLLQAQPLASYPLIFAAGRLQQNGGLREHYNDGSLRLNLQSALTANGSTSGQEIVPVSTSESARVAHMWLSAIGWGILIPIGIVGARAKSQLPKWWYNIHRIIQSVGYIFALAGFAAGFAVQGQWEAPNYETEVHRDLGVTITVLGTIQVISLVAKPSPTHKWRKFWSPWHIWLGRSAAILAIVNIYYGMFAVVEDFATWAWALYTGLLAAIILVGIGSEFREYNIKKQSQKLDIEATMDKPASKKSIEASNSFSSVELGAKTVTI